MNRLCVICFTASVLVVAATTGDEPKRKNAQEYYHAKHGFDGGLIEMIDLTEIEGFDEVLTIDDLAKFASKVPGAKGFTVHPHFLSEKRNASAVLWYTRLSPTKSSWQLCLFDETIANKKPGEAPEASAVAAAKAKVSRKLRIAEELIDAGAPNGVKVSASDEEGKVLALAVMLLRGTFAHTGEFGDAHCAECRRVVPSEYPHRCGLGVRNLNHWNCCGASEDTRHCRYWELIKAQDDAKEEKKKMPGGFSAFGR